MKNSGVRKKMMKRGRRQGGEFNVKVRAVKPNNLKFVFRGESKCKDIVIVFVYSPTSYIVDYIIMMLMLTTSKKFVTYQ